MADSNTPTAAAGDPEIGAGADVKIRLEGDPRAQLEQLLAECVRVKASDLHLSPGFPPYARVQGVLAPRKNHYPLSASDIETLVGELTWKMDRGPLTTRGSLDGAVTSLDGTRFRFNVYRRQGELSVALRKLDDEFRTLRELGLPETLYNLSALNDGLVIVAGPTGAGKSTTLATLIDKVNHERRSHIITIEDPIEYIHHPTLSLINQRQIGGDARDFNEALVASLRQDPDVILVGEIRDLETIRTAITAAETGHLVFTTVHAGDCVGVIERLVAVFPSDEQEGVRRQLALVLRAVVAQHLMVADGSAAAPKDGGPARRVVASEVLMVNPAVANLIATGRSAQIYSSMESGAAQGMQTLEQDLARLWTGKMISETTALAMAKNPGVLHDRARLLLRRSAGNGSRSAR